MDVDYKLIAGRRVCYRMLYGVFLKEDVGKQGVVFFVKRYLNKHTNFIRFRIVYYDTHSYNLYQDILVTLHEKQCFFLFQLLNS